MAHVPVQRGGPVAVMTPASATRNCLAAGIQAMSGAHDVIVFDGNDATVWDAKVSGKNASSASITNNAGVVYVTHSTLNVDSSLSTFGFAAYDPAGVLAWDVPLEAGSGDVWSVPGGILLALGNGEVKRFDTTGAEVWTHAGFMSSVVSVMQNADGEVFATNMSEVHKLDNNGNLIWKLELPSGVVASSVCSQPDGGCVLAVDRDVLWVSPAGEILERFYGFAGKIMSMRPVPGGGFVGGSYDGTVRRVDPDGLQLWRYNTPNSKWVQSVDVALDGSVIAGSVDGYVYRLTSSGQLYSTFNANLSTLFSVGIV